jgi:hypothetical protein
VNGTVAQLVALTIHGNHALRHGMPNGAFYPANSTFNFCEYVRFLDLRRVADKWEESPFEDDPEAWFARLHDQGIRRLRLFHYAASPSQFEERKLAGFVGGGGRWIIEAEGADGSESWVGSWRVGARKRQDRRIWQVKYGRIAFGHPASDVAADSLESLKSSLEEVLQSIAAFADEQKVENFAHAFDSASEHLHSQAPLAGLFNADLAPSGMLSLTAMQLLAAVHQASVFGGMGSWNDLGFEGEAQHRYEELSESLYQLLNRSTAAAASSSSD